MPRSPDARHSSRESRHVKREVLSSDEEDRKRSRDRRRDHDRSRDRDVDRRRRSRDRDDYRRRRSPSRERERSSRRKRSPSPRRRRSRSPERRRRSRSPRRSEGRMRSPKQEPRSPIDVKPPRRDDGDNSRREKRFSPPKSAFDRKEPAPEELIPWGGFPPPSTGPPEEPIEKEKPSLEPSGKLLEDTNMVNGVVVKYVEPPEAKLPKVNWQLHPFKNEEGKEPEPLPVMHIHRRSCYLIGRDRKVVQFPMDHPSCSKQHAALQYRSLPYTRPDGERGRKTKPYLIDLESANGTFLNDERLDPLRYYELHHMDEIRFGFSSRSFMILNTSVALAQLESDKATKAEQGDSDDDEPEQKPKIGKLKAMSPGEERFEI
uniref:FHA domain-containing protein n=1 Tax=Panagrellus redivivus TaxID=6233 RepID=A0A7E4UVT7_PANRE